MRSAKSILAAAACAALLLLPASVAQGADLLYWNNFGENTVSFADTAGNGGGPLNLGGVALEGPEGMAFDSATGRLFVTSFFSGPEEAGEIVAVNVDGSGAAVFRAPGAPVKGPLGIAIDPVARMIYWANIDANSIAWARLDGSAGGTLNTAGATVAAPKRVALDPSAGRIYWANNTLAPETISFANLNNSGGGDLNLAGATQPASVRGMAVDPVAGRLYWLDGVARRISYANLNGSGAADLDTSGAQFFAPFGLAFDPLAGRFYWGNEGGGSIGAIGFANLVGGGGAIDIATAPADGPQDPVILKSPTGTAAPLATRVDKSRSSLACSTGTWAPDFAGSNVYRAPSKFAYQWLRDGQPVVGSTAASLNATSAGGYACTVTASNQAGAATQTSAPLKVASGQLKLTLKRKVVAKPGGLARLKLQIANVGDLATKPARICLKTGKRAKALKSLKCKKLGPMPAGAKLAGTLKLKVGAGASGTYKVKLTVKGAPAKAATAKIVVRGSK